MTFDSWVICCWVWFREVIWYCKFIAHYWRRALLYTMQNQIVILPIASDAGAITNVSLSMRTHKMLFCCTVWLRSANVFEATVFPSSFTGSTPTTGTLASWAACCVDWSTSPSTKTGLTWTCGDCWVDNGTTSTCTTSEYVNMMMMMMMTMMTRMTRMTRMMKRMRMRRRWMTRRWGWWWWWWGGGGGGVVVGGGGGGGWGGGWWWWGGGGGGGGWWGGGGGGWGGWWGGGYYYY